MPEDHPPVPAGVTSDSCPVDESARSVWLQAGAIAHPLAPSSSSPSPATGSAASLGAEREISSIPRGARRDFQPNSEHAAEDAATPDGEAAKGNWVYPSEQQFFNAMLRKNHQPRAADMRTVVPIHNAVNERAWEQVLAWEAGMGGEKCAGGVRLSSFVGRPRDRTPKAWVKSVLG